VNLMKFNKAKHKALHLSWGNPKYKYRLGGQWIESNAGEKFLGVRVDQKLNTTQQCALSLEGQPYPGLHQMQHGHQAEEWDSIPLLCAGEIPPGVLCPDLEPSAQERQESVGVDPEEATKMIRGLKQLSYGERPRELALIHLEKRSLQGDLLAAFQYLKGAYRKDGEGLFRRWVVTGQRVMASN